MWVVYVIQHSVSKDIYIGVTGNLKRRIEEHNANKNFSTKRKQGKWIIVYAEAYRNKNDAYQREFRLKQRGRAKQELLKRIARSLLTD